jgi:exopolyphosphatase/guanosine-5'-triphosphate,3'-diphosphate pyrophosphatase
MALSREVAFGSIDIGSNSVRCLAAGFRGGVLEYIDSGAWITRLTEGIEGGIYEIRPEAVTRTADAVRKACSLLAGAGVGAANTAFFATEGLRSAAGCGEAAMEFERAAGLPLSIITGSDEADLSRKGAMLGTRGVDCVFDLGGGSLELGWEGGSLSLPAGAVRMQGRFGENRGAISEELLSMLEGRRISVSKGLAGVGGTSSTVAMMLMGVPVPCYHPARIHGHRVTAAGLEALVGRISGMSPGERRSITGLEEKRADIIVPGMIVIKVLLERLHLNGYTHSETDLLWAACAEMAKTSGLTVFSASPA